MVTQSPAANPRRNQQSWQSQTWWCILPVLGIALCISVFALSKGAFTSSTGVQKAAAFAGQSAEPSTSGHNSEGLSGALDLEQCKQVPQLRMCSHQVRGATSSRGVMEALRELYQMGVRCYDIDLVTTADQQLLVTHPRALQAILDVIMGNSSFIGRDSAIHFHSLKSVRQLGGNSSSFPTAAEFLEEFARLVKGPAEDHSIEESSSGIAQQAWDPHRMPFVFVELKDAAFNTEAINWLWAEVLDLGLVNNIALYVTNDQQPSMLAQQTYWQGTLIHGIRDTANDDDQGGFDRNSMQSATLISPSIKLSDTVYQVLQQAGKPVFSWVVDSPLQVRSALTKQVDGIISNDPLFLKLVLKSWWKRCRST